jgi:phosphohistidine phosphatase
MKKLYIIRHAKSSWDDTDQPDFERPLNNRGVHDADKIAQKLNVEKISPDLILSSPAKRALTTANIFAVKLNYPIEKIVVVEKIYEAGLKELTSVLQAIENSYKNVMLFGHNPGLTSLVNMLSDKPVPHLPTCAVVGLKFNIESWEELERYSGEIFLFEFPKNK